MPVELLSRDLVHTTDAIELPSTELEVVARAERRDSYPIAVTRSPEQTIERLLQVVGERRVVLITDETVAKLYGPLVIGALDKAGVEPEVVAVPPGAPQDAQAGVRAARLAHGHAPRPPGHHHRPWRRRRDRHGRVPHRTQAAFCPALTGRRNYPQLPWR
jgi:hypothetical protein